MKAVYEKYKRFHVWMGDDVVTANDLANSFKIALSSARHNLNQLKKLGLVESFLKKNATGFVCVHFKSLATIPEPLIVDQSPAKRIVSRSPAERMMDKSRKAYLGLCKSITKQVIRYENLEDMDDWYLPMCHINAWPFTNPYGDLYVEERLYGFKPEGSYG